MSDSVYDIIRLESSGEIDAQAALGNFSGNQAYFDELDRFVAESKHYLRGYTASVVIYNEDVRKGFLEEAEELKTKLASLGMTGLADAIEELAVASGGGSAETLSDWILRLHAQIDSIIKLIRLAKVSEAAPNVKTEKPVILAADDKPELLTSIVAMLSPSYRVIAVTSGSAALNVIKKHTPALFLLDIEMPGMNGYELAKAVRSTPKYEKTPIVFLTGKNTRNDVIEAIRNGGNDYLLKPVEKSLLLEKLKHYLG